MGSFIRVFPKAKIFLLVGAFVGLLVGAVSGKMTGYSGLHDSETHSEAVQDCCKDAHSSDFDCDAPCPQDQQECPDHPGEHHHHHSCTCGSPHLFAGGPVAHRVAVPDQKRSPIEVERQLVPDSPVLSEDKPPLI